MASIEMSSDCDMRWMEVHYCNLESQVNIYTLTRLGSISRLNKVLVSSIASEFVTLEFFRNGNDLQPLTRHLQFSDIPGDAEVVSLHSFTCNRGPLITFVGITFVKVTKVSSPSVSGQSFNIYTCRRLGEDCETVTDGCQHIELNFTPLQLAHACCCDQKVFILSGNDCNIHVYKEDTQSGIFIEVESLLHGDCYFPEFVNITSSILWIDIKYADDCQQRITTTGHQSGLVSLFVTDVTKSEVIRHFTTKFDGPVTTVLLFTDGNNVKKPEYLITTDEFGEFQTSRPCYNLLVTPSIEKSVIYRDVMNAGFTGGLPLPSSDQFDVVTCACAVDMDFDGCKEIVLGTYKQELLVYKQCAGQSKMTSSSDGQWSRGEVDKRDTSSNVSTFPDISGYISKSEDAKRTVSHEDISTLSSFSSQPPSRQTHSSGDDSVAATAYRLAWKRSLPDPVLAIDHLDLTGDGLQELVVATLKGIHVLQADIEQVTKMCADRLKVIDFDIVQKKKSSS